MSELTFSSTHLPFSTKRVVFSLFIHGAVSISWQILLIRSVMSVFQGNEVLIGFCLCFYLIWMAVGSWFGGRFLSRFKQTPYILVALFSLSALSMPFSLLILTSLKTCFFISALTIISAYQALLATFIICAPYCFFAGAIFPLCIKMLPENKNAPLLRISRAYGFEAFGSGLGALFLFFLIIPNVQPVNAALFLAALLFSAGLVLVYSQSVFRIGIPLLGGLIYLCLYLGITDTLLKYQKQVQWPERTWVTGQNTRKGYLEVVRLGEQHNLYLNGSLLAISDFDAISLKSVQMAMGQTHPPQRILLMGSRLTGCVNELSHYNVKLCDFVNSNALEVEWSRSFLWSSGALDPESCNIHAMDERNYIRNTSPGKYDLIIISKPSPASLELNRFYTVEFFRQVFRVLDEDGLLMLIMDASSVDLTLPNLRFFATVSRTMDEVFTSKIIIPGAPCLFLASKHDNLKLSDRQLKVMRAFSGTVNITPAQLSGLISQQYGTVAINSDFHPIGMLINLGRGIYRYLNPLPWLADYAGTRSIRTRALYSGIVVCLFGVVCFGMSRNFLFTPFMAFLIGFSSMAYQVIVLFFFQILFGDLYYHIGFLIALFMTGIAFGTIYHNYTAGKWSPLHERMIITAGVLSFIALPVVLLLLTRVSTLSVWFFILSFASGVTNGLVFPVLVARTGAISGRPDYVNAGGLYAWDSAGASIGALTAGVLMIALLGGFESLLFLAAINGVLLVVYRFVACR